MGNARTLEAYFAFCGVNFKTHEESNRGLVCDFSEDLHKYRKKPFCIAPAPDIQSDASSAPRATKEKKPKIFGIGLPRSATASAAMAMMGLGFKTGYTCFDNGKFDSGEAFFNTPVYVDYPSLDRRYPGSKYLLTWREPSKWAASFSKNLNTYLHMLRSSDNPNLSTVDRRCYTQVFGKEDLSTEAFLIACYRQHRKNAEDFFRRRPQDLLILDLDAPGDPWEPLCRFLGCRQPQIPFPRLNSGMIGEWSKIHHKNKL